MIVVVRLIIGGILIVIGLFFSITAVLGTFRLEHIFNRIHAAAKCDTISVFFILSGLCVLSGEGFVIAKLILLIGFLWFTSPVSVHLIGRIEYDTDQYLCEKFEVIDL